MVKSEVEDLKKNNKELETDGSVYISSCSFKDKVEKANLVHIDKEDTYLISRAIPSFKRKRISTIIISDDENSNGNEEDMAVYKFPSWGAKRARSKRARSSTIIISDSETSCDDDVPISTLIRRSRIKKDSEDEDDHDLNSTDSLYNGDTSSEYEENNDDLEEVSESSDEDEENIDDLEEGCESSDESMNDSSENDSNHAFGGGDSGDESDNVSSKSITPHKSYSSEDREDNDDQEKEPEGEHDSLNGSIIYISENDSVHASGGGDNGDECEDETDYDVNTSINLYKNISSEDEEDEEDNDESDEDWEAEDDTLGGSIADSSKNDSECSYKSNKSGDECEATSNDLQLNERIPRKRVCNRKWDLEGDMLAAFGKDDNLCLRAVCTLYRQQTEDEKSSNETRYRNNRGFSKADAPRGSELAEFLMDGDPAGDLKKTVEDLKQYDSKGIRDCREFATTYSKQLFQIYQNKEDPYFPSSASE